MSRRGKTLVIKSERLAIIENWRSPETGTTVPPDESSSSAHADAARATREARIALAAIGRRWFLETDPNPAVAEAELADTLACSNRENTRRRPPNSPTSAARSVSVTRVSPTREAAHEPVSHPPKPTAAGVGISWNSSPERGVKPPAQAEERLLTADRLVRLLDAAGADRIVALASAARCPVNRP